MYFPMRNVGSRLSSCSCSRGNERPISKLGEQVEVTASKTS
ncbi:hypothetical protein OIU78_006357 [Salix suchowensis]|nr:hypothetical protein OIU78_006357 [Salix suchowensis]